MPLIPKRPLGELVELAGSALWLGILSMDLVSSLQRKRGGGGGVDALHFGMCPLPCVLYCEITPMHIPDRANIRNRLGVGRRGVSPT